MEDKTLLEELLERSPDERMHKRKMDKAYQLMAMGLRDEADALFDEILAEELALRDMDGEPLTRENYSELMDRIDTYLSEFDQHGTDHISVDLDE